MKGWSGTRRVAVFRQNRFEKRIGRSRYGTAIRHDPTVIAGVLFQLLDAQVHVLAQFHVVFNRFFFSRFAFSIPVSLGLEIFNVVDGSFENGSLVGAELGIASFG